MLLQIDTAAAMAETIAQEAEPAKELSLIEMCVSGGPIMIVLGALLILAIYIFVERMIVFHKASREDVNFMNRIKDYMHEGKIDAAVQLCRNTDSPSSRMIEKGLSRLGRPMSDVLVAIENVGNIEIATLEKGLSFMATIAGGGPMIGFLGTVIGMVQAFFNMEQAGGNTINLSMLSGGIYTAMVTTVAGLIVGVIAFFGYNYLVTRLDTVMRQLEMRSMDFLDLLNEPSNC